MILIFIVLVIAFIIQIQKNTNLRTEIENIKNDKESSTPEKVLSPNDNVINYPKSDFSAQPIMTETAAINGNQESNPNEFGDKLFLWLKEDWLMKLGALFLIFGFGWLVTYAFTNKWIGPITVITLSVAIGAGIMIFGSQRIKKFQNQGSVFIVLGATIVHIASFAARNVYDIMTPLSALALMFISATFTAFTSVKYKIKSLAIASLLMASLAPLLVKGPSNYINLFAYLLVVVVGTLWVVVLTNNKHLTILAFAIITFYSLPHFGSQASYIPTLLIFANIFGGIFFGASLWGLMQNKSLNELRLDAIVATLNSVFVLLWITTTSLSINMQSVFILVWMIVYVNGGFFLHTYTKNKETLYLYAGISVMMLGIVTSLQFHGATLTTIYTLESALLVVLSYLYGKNINVARRVSLILFGPALLSLISLVEYSSSNTLFSKDFFVISIEAITIFALGVFFYYFGKGTDENSATQGEVMMILGTVYMYIILWLALGIHFATNPDIAVTIAMVIYAFVGLCAYLQGSAKDMKDLKIYGSIMLGLVILRLLFIDIWNLTVAWRIVTFMAIGVLFISTAFLKKKNQ